MKKQWTNEQRRAIEENGNLLVSAAAGSGKTAVLTERFVRLVSEGASVSEFLCVTFTNAAAAEMKKRVEAGLTAAADAAEDETVRAHLRAAARDAARANISTLHSFCAEVLRRHFQEAGLDPAFRVADEAETLVMKQEAWDEAAEVRCADESGRFDALVDALCRYCEDEKLVEMTGNANINLISRKYSMNVMHQKLAQYYISAMQGSME